MKHNTDFLNLPGSPCECVCVQLSRPFYWQSRHGVSRSNAGILRKGNNECNFKCGHVRNKIPIVQELEMYQARERNVGRLLA